MTNARFVLDPVCVSCTAPEDDPNTFAVSDHWKVVLHPDQTVPGALLLVTIRHVPKLSDLREPEAAEFSALLSVVERALETDLDATMVNFSCLRNWAYREIDPEPPLLNGHANPHVHWHVAPRYADVVHIAGESFVDEDFGEQLTWQRQQPSEAVRTQLIDRLITALTRKSPA